MLVFAGALFLASLSLADGWDASLADFQRQNGERDDTARIQRLVDAHPEGTVYLPKGIYLVSAPVVVTNMCSLELNKGAVLRATGRMPFVLKVNPGKLISAHERDRRLRDYNLFVSGGCIDGDGFASCMALDGFKHFSLANVTFLNGREYGLRVCGETDGYEIIANNLYFKCVKSGLAGNTALYTTGGDSHYTDCVVVDYTVGIRSRGGSNRFTRCHVWGGPVPPTRKGELPEMLKDSVCYWIGGGGDALRDCYADTGKTGFRIEGDAQLFGCWYFNNKWFRLDDITIIDHWKGRLLVSGGRFSKDSPNVRIYSCASPFAQVAWRDMTYIGFADVELPGASDWKSDPKFDIYDQKCVSPDDWEFLQDGPYRFFSKPDEFAGKVNCRTEYRHVSTKGLLRRFPSVTAGREFVIRARATCPDTKEVEIAFFHGNGRVWGMNLPLTLEWADIRIPFSKLRYFSHWGGVPPDEGGEILDARKIVSLRFCFGKWLCPRAVDKAHGFEISSIRITR